jgi:hypothetical protein
MPPLAKAPDAFAPPMLPSKLDNGEARSAPKAAPDWSRPAPYWRALPATRQLLLDRLHQRIEPKSARLRSYCRPGSRRSHEAFCKLVSARFGTAFDRMETPSAHRSPIAALRSAVVPTRSPNRPSALVPAFQIWRFEIRAREVELALVLVDALVEGINLIVRGLRDGLFLRPRRAARR